MKLLALQKKTLMKGGVQKIRKTVATFEFPTKGLQTKFDFL